MSPIGIIRGNNKGIKSYFHLRKPVTQTVDTIIWGMCTEEKEINKRKEKDKDVGMEYLF